MILSSALSLQKSLFRVASPFVQRSPDDLNNVVVNNFLAATVLDDGCYSEPIMYLRLLLLFEEQPKDRRAGWISKHSISYIRFLHFRTSTFDCMRRVRRLLHNSSFRANKLSDINDGDITIKSSDLGNEKLNMLRLLLTWTCDENIMKQESSTLKMDQSPEDVVIMSPEFKEDHLRELLPKAITWSVRGSGSARIVQFLTDSNEAQNSATYSPLIRDVKEGVRILNALRGTHRDGVMFRRLPADDDNKAVVGSREWSRAKRDQSSTDDYFELKCKILNPKWIFYGLSTFGGSGRAVFLPKQSLVALATPACDQGDIFAVPYKINEVLSREGKLLYLAEGVTLLPPGEKWLAMALHCMRGASLSSDDYTISSRTLTRLMNPDILSKKELTSCCKVAQYLFLDSSQEIRRCADAIIEVKTLFAAWTDDRKVPYVYSESMTTNLADMVNPTQLFMSQLPSHSSGNVLPRSKPLNMHVEPTPPSASVAKPKKLICPWCDKSFSDIRYHIAFMHPDKLSEYLEVSQAHFTDPPNAKSGLVCAADPPPEDDRYLHEYLSALRTYYDVPINKNRIENLSRHLMKISLQCIFCRSSHVPSLNVHLPELHALLSAVENKTGPLLFGPKFQSDDISKLELCQAEKYDQRYEKSFSPSIVRDIVNNHLRSVYGIKKRGVFGDAINERMRKFLYEARKNGNDCDFCGASCTDIPGHLVGLHLAEIHAAIGGLGDSDFKSSKNITLTSLSKDDIITGTTLIVPASSSSTSKLKSAPKAKSTNFMGCPKCDFESAVPLDLADHYGSHFNSSFCALTAKKKTAVKIKTSCPICRDKKLFMQYGQLLDHISGSHPLPTT